MMPEASRREVQDDTHCLSCFSVSTGITVKITNFAILFNRGYPVSPHADYLYVDRKLCMHVKLYDIWGVVTRCRINIPGCVPGSAIRHSCRLTRPFVLDFSVEMSRIKGLFL